MNRVGNWKWCLILPSLKSYHEWKVLLHAVNVRYGTISSTFLVKEAVLQIVIALKNPGCEREPRDKWQAVTTRPLIHEQQIKHYGNPYIYSKVIQLWNHTAQEENGYYNKQWRHKIVYAVTQKPATAV
jgi:hypothetical protein